MDNNITIVTSDKEKIIVNEDIVKHSKYLKRVIAANESGLWKTNNEHEKSTHEK